MLYLLCSKNLVLRLATCDYLFHHQSAGLVEAVASDFYDVGTCLHAAEIDVDGLLCADATDLARVNLLTIGGIDAHIHSVVVLGEEELECAIARIGIKHDGFWQPFEVFHGSCAEYILQACVGIDFAVAPCVVR